jgi:dUTP pyrophosphatase
MKETVIRVKTLAHHDGLPLPRYATSTASGMDLHAAIEESISLAPGQRVLVPTGLRIELPPGTEGQIRPRSGLAMEHGVTILNAPGTIDSDYRGEIKILLINLGENTSQIYRGDRIAQLVIHNVLRGEVRLVEALENTERGEGGFGHTGR